MATPESFVWRQIVSPVVEALVFLVLIGGLAWVAVSIWIAVIQLVEAHAR